MNGSGGRRESRRGSKLPVRKGSMAGGLRRRSSLGVINGAMKRKSSLASSVENSESELVLEEELPLKERLAREFDLMDREFAAEEAGVFTLTDQELNTNPFFSKTAGAKARITCRRD